MRLARQRRRRRRPRQTVLIHARIPVVANPGQRIQIHRQLQRRYLRLPPHLRRRHLVHRNAGKVVGALRMLRRRRAQESRIRRVMRPRIRRLQPQIRDDRHLAFHRFQRLQNRRKLSKRTLPRRRPPRLVAPHRNKHKPQPPDGLARSLCPGRRRRNHRIQQWQRQRAPRAP